MEKKITIIIGCVFAIGATAHFIAQGSTAQDPIIADKYCVGLKDGQAVLMQDNKPVTGEVTLNDGSKVSTSGVVIKKDGSVVVMKNGDCIDKQGNINNVTSPQTPIKEARKITNPNKIK